MNKNSINSFFLFVIFLIVSLGCGSYKNINTPDKGDVERGRLRFATGVTYIHIGTIEIYHSVTKAIFVNGKKWSPDGNPNFTDDINWCSTSPNPNVEVLKCPGKSNDYRTTYIVRMRDDKPEVQKIDDGLRTSDWINDGHWLKLDKTYVNVETGEQKERGVTRGRLKFGRADHNEFDDAFQRWYVMGIEGALFVNGERWLPPDKPSLAAGFLSCDTSPNQEVEILRCHNSEAIYLVRMKNDKPEVQKIPESNLMFTLPDVSKAVSEDPVNNIWISEEGRWLLFREFYLNVETGKQIKIKKISPENGKKSFVEPYKVIAVSPDMKTIVEKYDDNIYSEEAESFIKLEITDIETGKVKNLKVSLTKNPWLNENTKPENEIQPSPAPSKHFVWEKGANGKDKIVAPELSERFMPPTKK